MCKSAERSHRIQRIRMDVCVSPIDDLLIITDNRLAPGFGVGHDYNTRLDAGRAYGRP